MDVKRVAVLAGVVFLAGAGCGEEVEPRAGPTSPRPDFEDATTVSPGTVEYLAVFDMAEDPNELDALQDEILDTAQEHVAVAQAGCWAEVPDELDVEETTYVAGVVATTPEELAEAVDAVGREPIFEGQVTLIACG